MQGAEAACGSQAPLPLLLRRVLGLDGHVLRHRSRGASSIGAQRRRCAAQPPLITPPLWEGANAAASGARPTSQAHLGGDPVGWGGLDGLRSLHSGETTILRRWRLAAAAAGSRQAFLRVRNDLLKGQWAARSGMLEGRGCACCCARLRHTGLISHAPGRLAWPLHSAAGTCMAFMCSLMGRAARAHAPRENGEPLTPWRLAALTGAGALLAGPPGRHARRKLELGSAATGCESQRLRKAELIGNALGFLGGFRGQQRLARRECANWEGDSAGAGPQERCQGARPAPAAPGVQAWAVGCQRADFSRFRPCRQVPEPAAA